MLVLAAIVFFVPWGRVDWGKIEILPASTITVTGTAKLDQAPQIATFYASVSIGNDDKQLAVDAVNTKMTALLAALKNFGIADADIQTSQVSVYQNIQQPQTMMYPIRGGSNFKWQASNSITVKLRDTSKASGLTDLLNNSGATSVSGPNFAVDNTTSSDTELLTKAVADAKTKADAMAKAGGRALGKMITVSEGYSQPYPVQLTVGTLEKAATPIQPGTETLTKTVTATFELQ